MKLIMKTLTKPAIARTERTFFGKGKSASQKKTMIETEVTILTPRKTKA